MKRMPAGARGPPGRVPGGVAWTAAGLAGGQFPCDVFGGRYRIGEECGDASLLLDGRLRCLRVLGARCNNRSPEFGMVRDQ